MPATNARIDAYINKAADFAKPILKHLRELVHKACPGALEAMKWGNPFFEYEGSVLCAMAAFKEHCRFLFWKARLMQDPEGIMQKAEKHSMGNINNIKTLKDLPTDKILIAYIQEAMKLNENHIKLPPKKATVKQVKMDDVFKSALEKNKRASTVFENFTPGKKKDYMQWITEAKTGATKQKRIVTAIEWIAEGKSRNWKYEMKMQS